MAIQAKQQSPWLLLVLILIAVIVPAIQKKQSSAPTPESRQSDGPRTAPPHSSPPATGKPEIQNGYEFYRDCTLVAEKHNDGDSFVVHFPDGREETMRLYFVDCPESAFRSYAGGESNRQRIAEQARDLRVTAKRAVEIGQAAKHFTLDLLAKRPFTLWTRWDSPFHDQRYHAFIQVSENGKPQWLDQLLIANGLARLKTKPANLPDGTPAARHRTDLEAAQREAIRQHLGAWEN